MPRLAERQLDDLALGGAVADRDHRADRSLAAHERQRDRPEPRRRRDTAEPPDDPALECELLPGSGGVRAQPQSAESAVGLAPVVQARDGLLADVAALGERHGALVESGL